MQGAGGNGIGARGGFRARFLFQSLPRAFVLLTIPACASLAEQRTPVCESSSCLDARVADDVGTDAAHGDSGGADAAQDASSDAADEGAPDATDLDATDDALSDRDVDGDDAADGSQQCKPELCPPDPQGRKACCVFEWGPCVYGDACIQH